MIKIPKIQIAGLKSKAEIDLCIEAGADGFGFLLMLDYPRDDALDLETATRLSAYTKGKGLSVLISHSTDLAAIRDTAEKTAVDAFQVHNDSTADLAPETLRTIKSSLGDTALIKVLHIPAEPVLTDSLRAHAKSLAAIVDALIFDTKTIETINGKSYETLGGTGQTNNWDIARDLVTLVAPTPVIYAGGLTPDNVAQAIEHIRPYGVDVNSGVRKSGSCDKDPQRLTVFVKNAKRAFAAVQRPPRAT